ncbi:MAG: biotin--[acetyl-CoA-carboxylase] ligase [Actinomycetaceae bacterium]|nr:biotin--[acetyl-CoA-carboxylase] ligase [Actinomycetaceae bacterium]
MSRIHATPQITHLDTVDSVLTVLASQVAEQDSPTPLTTLTARHQEHGRGRAGRTWSDDGSRSLLMATLVRVRDEDLEWVTLVAGIAMARTLRHLGHNVTLKWPNDLILDGGKVGGILCEHLRVEDSQVSRTHWVAIGLGLNLGPIPADAGPQATTLGLIHENEGGATSAPTTPDPETTFLALRDEILSAFLTHLGTLIDEGTREEWHHECITLLAHLGHTSTVHLPDGTIRDVTPLGLSPHGALLCRADEELISIEVGDIHLPTSHTLPGDPAASSTPAPPTPNTPQGESR